MSRSIAPVCHAPQTQPGFEFRGGELERTRLTRGAIVSDSVFLTCVAFATTILWLPRVGFYSDDWNFLRIFRFAPSQSVFGLYEAAFTALPGARMRPLQLLYLAGSYKLWGLEPLGYHVVNAAVLSVAGILLWTVLRELGQPRAWALGSAVLYVTLPNYSTVRYWISAHQNMLSIVLYLLSFYADLRSLRAEKSNVWKWRMVGVGSLIGCVLSYEVALPLFFLNIGVMLLVSRRIPGSTAARARSTARLESLALLVVTLVKVLMQTRGSGMDAGYLGWIAGVAKNALVTHWLGFGIGLPLRAWNAAHRYPDARILITALALALAIVAYLWRVFMRHPAPSPAPGRGVAWVLCGALVFALGHAIFLVTKAGAAAGFTMTGKNNRVAVAATLGIAVCFVGGIGALSTLLAERGRRAVFASAVGLLAAAGFIVDSTVANFWVGAYRKEMAVLAAIQARYPRIPARSTLVLDGVCEYVGPASVFKTKWDLAGLLAVAYDDPTLQADVVSRHMSVRPGGLMTRTDTDEGFYPYSGRLTVFDARANSVTMLPDHAAAASYFQARTELECPPREDL